MVNSGEKVLIAPSILAADFGRLADEVKSVETAGADWLHIDVMDGHFVPNITIGPQVIRSVRGDTKLPFDVHLMINDPGRYLDDFINAGSDMITFHLEAIRQPRELAERIKKKGIPAGVSVKPGTSAEEVVPLLDVLDMVLVMTVEPGFGGQSFMSDMLDKISFLRKRFSGRIQVDGGITPLTARDAIAAGADVLVAGTSIFGKKDHKRAIDSLRNGDV